MPVLNWHKDVKDMPDMSKLQKCDTCGVEQIGNRMYYSYPKKSKIEVICRTCFVSHPSRPTKRAPDALRVCGKCGLSEQNHADHLCNPNYSAGKA